MAGTSGLSAATTIGVAQLALAAMNGGTALSITGPLKVLFLSAIRTANNGTDTQWATSGGYTSGTGFSGLTFAAVTADATGAHQVSNVAATITNAPAQTWAGCKVVDSAGTAKEIWYAPVSPSKTVNAGDTVTVPSGSFTTDLG
jgi:LysM repeat protein